VIGIENNGAVQNIKVDDGTGTIVARSFQRLIDVSVGDVVLLVGRIREYGSERYIMPEIVNKRVDRKWGIIWKRLAIKCKEAKVVQIPVVENYVVEESVSDNGSIAKIKELDEGEGAPFEQVIKFVSEQSIKHMLMSGEVFEIRPGRLKVLD
jgi:RPA family protein